jgi:hypothetical protein
MSGFQCVNGIAPCNSATATVGAYQGGPELGLSAALRNLPLCAPPRVVVVCGNVVRVLSVFRFGIRGEHVCKRVDLSSRRWIDAFKDEVSPVPSHGPR